jgi:hypothetical protein
MNKSCDINPPPSSINHLVSNWGSALMIQALEETLDTPFPLLPALGNVLPG